MTIQTVLADAMELSADDRAQLARWLTVCVRVDLELEPESVRKASDRDLREMLGGFQ
ncbi:hypothetical protein [Pseudoxanthomonas sp.]|uniref:hypothetical protein n=1 Tax=Pseudoxanthomonas sp. TaxID=1871049 RepID=UPI0025F68D57|nr:hypothetical protein [Pseudoxanthomonas sp.]